MSPTSPTRHLPALRHDAVSVAGATIVSVASVGPVVGLALIPQVIAGQAGTAVPFLFLVATVGAVCVAYTIGQFARRISNAGSFYAFNSHSLGPLFGFQSGWLVLIAYTLAFPALMLAFGPSLSAVLHARLDISVPWWILSTAGIVIVSGLTIAGLGLSVRVDASMLIIEMLILLSLAIIVVVKGGDSGNTVEVFIPTATGKESGLPFGLAFAYLGLVGFDAAANVSEETRDAERNIPRALLYSVLVSGAMYVFVSYAITIGYGTDHVGRFARDTFPLNALAGRYVGDGFSSLVDLAVVFATFSCAIASCNGGVRILFAMARDGALPAPLARVHSRLTTPYIAVLATSAFSLALILGLGLTVHPYPQAWSYVSAPITMSFLLLYVTVSASLIRYIWQKHHSEFSPIKHILVPVTGITLTGMAIYGSYDPLSAGVFSWINLGFIGYILAGFAMAAHLRHRSAKKCRTSKNEP